MQVKNGIMPVSLYRGKAEESGCRRIRAVEFLNGGLCPTTIFAFTLFFLMSVRSGNNQLSFSGARELCAGQT